MTDTPKDDLIERMEEHVRLAKSMGMFGVASKLVDEAARALRASAGREMVTDAMVEAGLAAYWNNQPNRHIAMRDALEAALSTPDGWQSMECATQDCGKPATVHFERGGVGSHYCHDCYMRVQALAAPTQGGGQ